MTKLMTVALLVLIAGAGCALDSTPENDDQFGTTEQDITGFNTAPTNYYYYQGGVYWFQDSYTGKWCTNATAQTASWDYGTTCSWKGWLDTSYHQYCDGAGAFWQNQYYHYHCS